MFKNIGIVGLGLIGASLAKAFQINNDHTIMGFNRTHAVTEKALNEGTIDMELCDKNISEADLLIISLFPQACVDYILRVLPLLKPGTVIIDIAGVKTSIIEQIEDDCKKAGVIFVGGHPMAGLEVIGYDNSIATLFNGASMILVPTSTSNDEVVNGLEALFLSIGFGTVIKCDAKKHDRMIAYTSQLCHVVSNCYVKNEASEFHCGFSGGSYRDLTRVAKLNEHMWNELFLLNKDALLSEIDEFIGHMKDMRDSIESEDKDKLTDLLRIGRERKENF